MANDSEFNFRNQLQFFEAQGFPLKVLFERTAQFFPRCIRQCPHVDFAVTAAVRDTLSVPSLRTSFDPARLESNFLKPAADDQLVAIHIKIAAIVEKLGRRFPAVRRDADNATNHAFTALYDFTTEYAPDEGQFDAWLFTVTRNLTFKLHRVPAKFRNGCGLGGAPEPADGDHEPPRVLRPLAEMVREVFARLDTEDEKLLFVLRFVEHRDTDFVRTVFGLDSKWAALKRCERLAAKVRELGFEDFIDPDEPAGA